MRPEGISKNVFGKVHPSAIGCQVSSRANRGSMHLAMARQLAIAVALVAASGMLVAAMALATQVR
jgi:hypothetical protein